MRAAPSGGPLTRMIKFGMATGNFSRDIYHGLQLYRSTSRSIELERPQAATMVSYVTRSFFSYFACSRISVLSAAAAAWLELPSRSNPESDSDTVFSPCKITVGESSGCPVPWPHSPPAKRSGSKFVEASSIRGLRITSVAPLTSVDSENGKFPAKPQPTHALRSARAAWLQLSESSISPASRSTIRQRNRTGYRCQFEPNTFWWSPCGVMLFPNSRYFEF